MDEKNNTTERPAPKAPENAPVRRVGTLTLGVCLIVCGVLFLCYFFVPHFNWDLALKIAPPYSSYSNPILYEIFTKKGSGTFFVYRRFCGGSTQNGEQERTKAGYHHGGGALPFALHQVRIGGNRCVRAY